MARALDKRITQVGVGFYDVNKKIVLANSEGLYVEDTQTLASLRANCAALEGQQRSHGYESKSGSYGYEHFDIKLAEGSGAHAPRRWPSATCRPRTPRPASSPS